MIASTLTSTVVAFERNLELAALFLNHQPWTEELAFQAVLTTVRDQRVRPIRPRSAELLAQRVLVLEFVAKHDLSAVRLHHALMVSKLPEDLCVAIRAGHINLDHALRMRALSVDERVVAIADLAQRSGLRSPKGR